MNLKTSIDVLNHYNLTIPPKQTNIKRRGEKILAQKLCRCIRLVNSKIGNTPRSIGICTKTIINNHKLVRRNFSCTKPVYVNVRSRTKQTRHKRVDKKTKKHNKKRTTKYRTQRKKNK
jgi:hypothetical protein